jgi:hypothetical protein
VVNVLNITNPGSPTKISEITLPNRESSRVAGMLSIGNHLYIRSDYCSHVGTPSCENSVQIIDITNPDAPHQVGEWSASGQLASNYGGLAAKDHYLYEPLLDNQKHKAVVRVWDVSNPAEPVQAPAFEYDSGAVASIIGISGNYLYITTADASGHYSLRVLDISEAGAPVEVNSLTLAGSSPTHVFSGGLSVENELGFIALEDGLQVIDVSNPAAPVNAGVYHTPGPVHSVTARGRYAYVAYDTAPDEGMLDTRLQIVDFAQPGHPRVVGGFPEGQQVHLSDHYIYVAAGDALFILEESATISGRVADVNGTPFAGVTISAGPGLSTTTEASGVYTFTELTFGTYTLTPTLEGYAFVPPTRTVTVPSDAHQNFTILPAPVSATLEPDESAQLVYTDTQGLPTELLFPTGAVSQTTSVVLTPTLAGHAPDAAFAGHAFDLAVYQKGQPLPGFTFNEPVTVTIRYSDVDVRVVTRETELSLWWWTGSAWQEAHEVCNPATVVTRDTPENELSVGVCRAGRYALYGPTYQQLLPIIQQRATE